MEGKGGPLFNALFIYQARAQPLADEDKRLYETIDGQGEVEFEIAAEAEIMGQELVWRAACSARGFDAASVGQFLEDLDSVLRFMVESPEGECLTVDAEGIAVCGLPKFALALESMDQARSATPVSVPIIEGSAWSETERSIRTVLSSVADMSEDDIFQDSTFQSLGLDSISAIKVSKLLRNQGIFLSVGALLRASTIRSMAEVCSRQEVSNGGSQRSTRVNRSIQAIDFNLLPGVSLEDVESVLPATSGQVYMLSMWQNSNGRLFWPTFSYAAPKSWTHKQIVKAWDTLIQDEAILRTRFVGTGSQPPVMQVVLRRNSLAVNKNQLVNLILAEEPDRWNVQLRIHHAVYDAVSLPILIRRLNLLCNDPQHTNEESDESFQRYVDETSTSEVHEEARRFWSTYLENAPNPLIRVPTSVFPRRVEFFEPSVVEDSGRLEKLARINDIAVHHLLLAAYAKAYSRLLVGSGDSHPPEVVIGVYLANRSHDIPGLAESTSPTLNLVPLRVLVDVEGGLVMSAKKIQSDLLELSRIEFATAGLWEIRQWTGVRVDSFVNILKLPDSDEAADAAEGIRAVNGDEMGYRRVVEWEGTVENDELSQMLQKNGVRDTYLVRC